MENEMAFVYVAPIDESLPETIEAMDKAMNDWTDKAARGECAWVCSDCCCSQKKKEEKKDEESESESESDSEDSK